MKALSTTTLVLVGTLCVAAAQERRLPMPRDEVRQRETEALNLGGLRAAAVITGHYQASVSAEPETNIETLEQLVAWHELIVVGRMVSHQGWLTLNGKEVVTDYHVEVEEVLKGTLPRGTRTITVAFLGGRVSFEDGSTATLTSTMPAPQNGQRFVLFLDYARRDIGPSPERLANASLGRVYTSPHLRLGVFLLDDERGVVPRARPAHPLQRLLGGVEHDEFIQSVRKLGRG